MHLKFGHNLMFTRKYEIASLNVMQKHIFMFSTQVEEYKPYVKFQIIEITIQNIKLKESS